MKKVVLALLCCNVLLYSCDRPKDSANVAVSVENKKATESANTAGSDREISSDADTKTSAVSVPVYAGATKRGASIYKSKCATCHGTGAAGAPRLDDKAAWASRIAQGSEVLTLHVIEGYRGNTGYMPPKGGHLSLSDDDISLVVQYIISQLQ